MSEQRALEILSDFCDALEAAAVNVKRQIAELQGVAQKGSTWNPEKIKWEQAQGSSGPYERSEDVNNPDFKAMLKDLQAHKGKMNREGLFFWVFENGYTVGRKKQGAAKEKGSAAGSNPGELFPEDLRGLLSFEQKEGFCIIKPRQFLGSENFEKIADIVKGQGGEYISAGKDSHFKIPLKTS
jgi:hypothetical protein